jgi:hypothetical protein
MPCQIFCYFFSDGRKFYQVVGISSKKEGTHLAIEKVDEIKSIAEDKTQK